MRIAIDTNSIEGYRTFLKVKQLPSFSITGRIAEFPDEYASLLGASVKAAAVVDYKPSGFLFDYQRDIAKLALRKRKFAVFADCGLGKSLILLEYARAASKALGNKRVLILSPLMVVNQTVAEAERFYGPGTVEQVKAADLAKWMQGDGPAIGITNYDALSDEIPQGNLGALILDESSVLKSHYGAWGRECIRLGAGLEFKLCLTGTPAPNDRIEFANHAVFLDVHPTINAFLARYFINRGQTSERWEIKPHAIGPFYRDLSHWCIFLTNPATYGWKDNAAELPPIKVHIHDVELTTKQKELVGQKLGTLFAGDIGGITTRSALSQIAKGSHKGERIETHKPEFIRDLVATWPDESTLIWCLYNHEQESMERMFPDAGSISGATPIEERLRIIKAFQAGEIKTVITKPKILGFGLNLQIATRQVFSGLEDSYESFYQAVKRSNRIGSTRPLNVHIPVTDVERPMVDNVIRKAGRVQQDADVQEQLFRDFGIMGGFSDAS